MKRGLVMLALAACAAAALAQEPPAAPPTPEAGRKVYKSYCERCHGLNLAVGSAAFFDLRTFPKDDKPRFLTSVNKGKRAMPAWEGIVKPADIEAVWAYIGQVNGW